MILLRCSVYRSPRESSFDYSAVNKSAFGVREENAQSEARFSIFVQMIRCALADALYPASHNRPLPEMALFGTSLQFGCI